MGGEAVMVKKLREGFHSEVLEITPSMAASWLDAVPEYQRKIVPNQLRKLKLAISRGEWRLNGAAIVFNEKGDLIDGQHRLRAILESGKTVQSLVVTGVSKDELTFATLGDTQARKAADFIRVPNVHMVAAALRYIWTIENKCFPDGRGHGAEKLQAPIMEIVRLARKWAEDLSQLVPALDEASRVTGQGSFNVALVWYFKEFRPKTEVEKVSEFFARVGDGVGLERNSAVYQLRKRLMDRSLGVAQIPQHIRRGMVLKALNLHIMDKTVDKLVWNPDREDFPPLPGYKGA